MQTKHNYQVGGDHYTKMAMQPFALIGATGADFFKGSAIKYVSRYKDKNGIQDLRKAIETLRYRDDNHIKAAPLNKEWLSYAVWYCDTNKMSEHQRDAIINTLKGNFAKAILAIQELIKDEEEAQRERRFSWRNLFRWA